MEKREIRFRGKRIDGKGWVEGDLLQHYVHHSKNGNMTIVEGGCVMYEVDPNSVGQFTGLKDKNGKEIYEGDIVEYDTGNKGVVSFKNGYYYAYDGYATDSDEAEMKLFDDSEPFEQGFEFEIIGNIHETPELLNTKSLSNGKEHENI